MKRGSSGLSLVVALDKPAGMTSHDAVNRVRRVFGERRVGHTGTLDPLATGVLVVCVGPASRLDRYLTGHDKRYRVTARFGFETTTDDAEGEATVCGPVPDEVRDEAWARGRVEALVGRHRQVPPLYSAVKINGQRAYKLARSGGDMSLEPRDVQVYDARFEGLACEGQDVRWVFEVAVSKGTYIRSLVRDLGRELGCPAHLAALQRTCAGAAALKDCVSLESLESLGENAAVDPVRLLGFRVAFVDDARLVESGSKLDSKSVKLCDRVSTPDGRDAAGRGAASAPAPADGELVSVVVADRLKAVYRYDARTERYVADCVFSIGVSRG